jgi:mannose-1-phosphate guanylyltransferase
MLDIWLEVCRRAGISELFVNLHAHAGTVRTALASRDLPLKVHLSEEQVLLGSAGTLLANRDWVASEGEFWVFYADVLTNVDLLPMLALHRKLRPAATLGLYQVSEPGRCGIVRFDENNVVTEFVEKPAQPKSNWAFSGIMLATPDLINAIPQESPADLGFHVLPKLVNRMLAYPISDYLVDIGTMERYESAQISWPGL